MLFEKLPKLFSMTEFQETLSDNVGAVKKYYDDYLKNVKKCLAKETKEVFILPQNRDNVNKMSLSSVIKDWCESLDQTVFEQLFTDGTEKCLGLFRSVTNDDDLTITRLAKLATDLRIEDWDEKVTELYITSIRRYKETAEAHHSESAESQETQSTSTYQITFISKDYGWSAQKMNEYLHTKGVQFKLGGRIWTLYQKHAEKGYTSTKTHTYPATDGTIHTKVHTYWTQKGRLFIYDLLKADGILPLIE